MKLRCDHRSYNFSPKENSIYWSAPDIWGFIAQLVEHCITNAEAIGSNSVETLKISFRAKICNCLNCIYNCDDRFSIPFVCFCWASESSYLKGAVGLPRE